MNGTESKSLRLTQHQVLCTSTHIVNCITWVPHRYGLALLAAASDGLISFISFNQNKWDVVQFQGHKAGITCIACAPYLLKSSVVVELIHRKKLFL